MKKGYPYRNYSNIYEIAAGAKGQDGVLLSPNRAIYSAICSVLSIPEEFEGRKIELLGETPYDFSQEMYNAFQKGKIEPFLDIVSEASWISYNNSEEVKRNHIRERMEKSPSMANNFVAAKVRREYFPTSQEFQDSHYLGMDINSGITRIIAEELGVSSYPRNLSH